MKIANGNLVSTPFLLEPPVSLRPLTWASQPQWKAMLVAQPGAVQRELSLSHPTPPPTVWHLETPMERNRVLWLQADNQWKTQAASHCVSRILKQSIEWKNTIRQAAWGHRGPWTGRLLVKHSGVSLKDGPNCGILEGRSCGPSLHATLLESDWSLGICLSLQRASETRSWHFMKENGEGVGSGIGKARLQFGGWPWVLLMSASSPHLQGLRATWVATAWLSGFPGLKVHRRISLKQQLTMLCANLRWKYHQ